MEPELLKDIESIKLEHWFNMDNQHEKNKTIVNAIKYLNTEEGSFRDSSWRLKREWFLILTKEYSWIWQSENQILIPVRLDEIKYFHNRRNKKYSCFNEIIKNYLIAPYTLNEITNILLIPDNIKESLNSSNEFYLNTWIQHTFS